MNLKKTNPKVDNYFTQLEKWQEEGLALRKIVLKTGLTEELKWGVACYTFNNKNIVLIHTFKGYCALLFVKGALLKDTHQLLIQQTENVQAARQMRFTKMEQIHTQSAQIREYIAQAIEVEKAGLTVPFKKPSEFKMAEEFQLKLDKMPSLKKAFHKLTPGRQRAYLLHFSAPAQAKTRVARVEKSIPDILAGKGLHD